MIYKTAKENYADFMVELKLMTTKEIQHYLRMSIVLHDWAVKALEDTLKQRRREQHKK